MTKIEDFKNAPVGATATRADGRRAMKVDDEGRPWVYTHGFYMDDEDLTQRDYTLDRPAPTTAREALDLAWELAHEVKGGQIIPKGAHYLEHYSSGLEEYTAGCDIKITPSLAPLVRTVEPLPDPEPDWLDAPAVLAGFDGWSHDEREVFVPTGPHNHWTRVGSSLTSHWSDLRDVTPLYPKEGQDA